MVPDKSRDRHQAFWQPALSQGFESRPEYCCEGHPDYLYDFSEQFPSNYPKVKDDLNYPTQNSESRFLNENSQGFVSYRTKKFKNPPPKNQAHVETAHQEEWVLRIKNVPRDFPFSLIRMRLQCKFACRLITTVDKFQRSLVLTLVLASHEDYLRVKMWKYLQFEQIKLKIGRLSPLELQKFQSYSAQMKTQATRKKDALGSTGGRRTNANISSGYGKDALQRDNCSQDQALSTVMTKNFKTCILKAIMLRSAYLDHSKSNLRFNKAK